MASIYESTWFQDSGLWGGMSPIPQVPEVHNTQPLYTGGASYVSQPKTAPAVIEEKTTDLTENTFNLNLPADIRNSVTAYYKNLGKQTEQASKYYEKANMANKIAAYTNIAQGVYDLAATYEARDTVRLTNKQLDIQKDLIDLNIKNTETLLAERFRNSIADLQVVYASKNVDISSQALRSEIVGSGEDMGEDIASMHIQGSLQKKAIDFQKSMNKAQQKHNEQQAWINFGANMANSAMFLI